MLLSNYILMMMIQLLHLSLEIKKKYLVKGKYRKRKAVELTVKNLYEELNMIK